MTALRAALAEPVLAPAPGYCKHCKQYTIEEPLPAEPVQEPVAWLFTNLQSGDYDFCYQEDEHDHDREMWHKQPLYTSPPQRQAKPVQEPVAWYLPCPEGVDDSIFRDHRTIAACTGNNWTGFIPLYTAPPQRKPLDKDALIDEFCKTPDIHQFVSAFVAGARYAERAHEIGGNDE